MDEVLFSSASASLWWTRENIHIRITAHSIKWPGEKWRKLGPFSFFTYLPLLIHSICAPYSLSQTCVLGGSTSFPNGDHKFSWSPQAKGDASLAASEPLHSELYAVNPHFFWSEPSGLQALSTLSQPPKRWVLRICNCGVLIRRNTAKSLLLWRKVPAPAAGTFLVLIRSIKTTWENQRSTDQKFRVFPHLSFKMWSFPC